MFWQHNWLGVVWGLFILLVSGLPGDQFDHSSVEHADKAIHLILYSVWVNLLAVGFIKQRAYRWLRTKSLQKAIAIALVVGLLVELMQPFVFIQRTFEFSDMLFNAIGVLLGTLVFVAIYGTKPYC
ncbi:MAG: hypothetical protein Kow0075_05570 [Salibacteraceae bacterium]